MTGRRTWPCLLLVLGCHSFTRSTPLEVIPAEPPTRDRFQVWSNGVPYEMHAVRISPDSLTGVRYWQSPTCDSCRVTLARAEVDSVRTLAFDGAETGILGILLSPVILALVWASQMGGG